MIGDVIAAKLPRLRAEAESLMKDHGQIGTITRTLDETTNELVDAFAAVYSGKIRAYRGAASSTSDAAGQQVTVQPIEVRVPWHVAGIEPGMHVRIDQSADAELVGARIVVAAFGAGTQSVQRHLVCHLDED